MLAEIQPVQSGLELNTVQNLSTANVEKVKEEFLTYFYKEILKQAVSTPDFSFGEGDNNSLSKLYTSDLMVEKLAQELVQSGAFSTKDLFPAITENSAEPIK